MRVLLDTHVFLWWLCESLRLSARVREVLADGSNTLLFSSASVWALIIKIQSGKLRIPEEPEAFIVGRLALHSMDSLCVKLEHAVLVYTLPGHPDSRGAVRAGNAYRPIAGHHLCGWRRQTSVSRGGRVAGPQGQHRDVG